MLLQEPEVSEMPPQRTRVRRGAVSASVMTEEQATSYVKKVCRGATVSDALCTSAIIRVSGKPADLPVHV